MNFTVEQFLNVFERYNEALWPMQIVAYAVGIVLVVLALTKWKRASAVIFGALAVMWAGMAVGYMWSYFADINKAAYLFGVIFLAQAVLLAVAAVRERGASYGGRRDARMWVGLALIVYAMVAYPLLGMAFGHSYPRAPMFGLVPCPTTIFTFGMLLLAARPEAPAALAAAGVVGDRLLRRGQVRHPRGHRAPARRRRHRRHHPARQTGGGRGDDSQGGITDSCVVVSRVIPATRPRSRMLRQPASDLLEVRSVCPAASAEHPQLHVVAQTDHGIRQQTGIRGRKV